MLLVGRGALERLTSAPVAQFAQLGSRHIAPRPPSARKGERMNQGQGERRAAMRRPIATAPAPVRVDRPQKSLTPRQLTEVGSHLLVKRHMEAVALSQLTCTAQV